MTRREMTVTNPDLVPAKTCVLFLWPPSLCLPCPVEFFKCDNEDDDDDADAHEEDDDGKHKHDDDDDDDDDDDEDDEEGDEQRKVNAACMKLTSEDDCADSDECVNGLWGDVGWGRDVGYNYMEGGKEGAERGEERKVNAACMKLTTEDDCAHPILELDTSVTL